MSSVSRKLFNRNFVLLWLGQAVSQLANGAGYIAVIWWIQVETGSALALGTLAASQMMVAVLLGPFAGALADRWNRKSIIVVTDATRGGIYSFLAYLVWHESLSLPVLYLLMIMNAICREFFDPAIGAALPALVPDSELARANSLNRISSSAVNIGLLGTGSKGRQRPPFKFRLSYSAVTGCPCCLSLARSRMRLSVLCRRSSMAAKSMLGT